MNILITGGAGFIGSHVVRHFVHKFPQHHIFCLDALTYAGNANNIADLLQEPNFTLLVADICDFAKMEYLMQNEDIHSVIHLAAESHVDRSITDPFSFAKTNVIGTLSLLEAFRRNLKNGDRNIMHRFHQVSTDEVYGSLNPEDAPFIEGHPYAPNSPYSASKASADHFGRAYHNTFGLDVVFSSCSNNFGPNQFPEKLLPLFIQNIINNRPLPIYGDGSNIRDWLYVQNHVEAIEQIFFHGKSGEAYNVGGNNEWKNIDLIELLIELVDRKLGRSKGASRRLITYVEDRLGHDKRYAIDPSKIEKELEWTPRHSFSEAMEKTIDWYLNNQKWLQDIQSGNYIKENKKFQSTYAVSPPPQSFQ